MNLSEPFIKRPIMTTLLMLGIFLFGLVGYRQLPISDLPDIAYPVITVTAQNPGSNAEVMAENVTTILERQLMTIQSLKSIVSSSSSGLSQIVLEFDLNRNIDAASTDVSAALVQSQGNLPPSMPNPPTYQKTNPSDTPIMYVAVSSSSMTTQELYDWATTAVSQRISMVAGVSQVQVYGSQRATRVQLNPDKMAAMNIGIDTVAEAIKDATRLIPAGNVYNKTKAFILNPLGQITTGEGFNPIIVGTKDQAPVRVIDIGKGIDDSQYKDFFLSFWRQGEPETPSVIIAVTKQGGYNTVKVCNTIRNMLPEMSRQMPPAISLSVVFDASNGIKASIDDVKLTLLLAFMLVVLVIFLFLGELTMTIIPCIALPMAVVATFGLMSLNGYNLDILSMLALTLVVGFLVDDAIVVLENIVRHLEMGKSPINAAYDGSQQISATVLSMTLSLSAVFIPLIFMPGIIGRMFHEFAMVVVIAVLFSGVISLTLTPMLCSKFLKRRETPSALEKRAHEFMAYLLGLYDPYLKWILKKPLIPIGVAIASFLAALLLMFHIPQDFLPSGDTGAIQGLTQAVQTVSYKAMMENQKLVTEIIKKNPAIESIISAANITGFTPQNQGILYLTLKPSHKRKGINEVTKELTEALQPLSNIRTFLKPIPEINLSIGTGVQRAPYQYALSTLGGAEELYKQVNVLTQKMRSFPELINVSNDIQNDTPQLDIEILRDRASLYGISCYTIEEALNLAYGGGRISTYNTPINLYDIIVELEDSYRENPNSLNKLYLTSTNEETKGELIPLNAVAKWIETVGPMQVNHVDQFTSGTIFFDLKPGAALGSALKKIEKAATEAVSPTVMRHFQGTAEVFQETIQAMIPLLLLCIVVIYLLLGSLYESFWHPLTVLSTLPGALFGGLVTLYIFHGTLSLYAYVGLVVLIGIVLKNGIILVEFANELVLEGQEAEGAIYNASRERFRPILMTTVAAAMGAVPIALGMGADASSRRPLGLVILGGLLFAQFITYFFTPVVYLLIQRKLTQKQKETNGE